MRKLKTLFALLVLSFFTIGNVWGETVSITQSNVTSDGSGKTSYSDDYNIAGWTGRYAVAYIKSPATYSLQLGYNTNSSKGAYNSHITTPVMSGGATSITIQTKAHNGTSTASGRKFYLCSEDDLGYVNDSHLPSSTTYGSGAITSADGAVTISITGNPTQFHIYPDGTAYISSITVTYSTSSEPAVLFEQSGSEIDTLDFGTYKQYENDTEGPLELAVASLTLKQANFTAEANVTVYTNGSGLSVSQNVITPLDWDENGEKEITVYASTAYAGSFIGKTTGEDKTYFLYAQSATDEFENDTLPLKLIVTARNRIWVETEDANKGTATIDGGSIAYSETGSEVLNLVASPKPGYVFKNWTVDEDNIVIDDEDAASTTASTIIGEATITAHFDEQGCTNLVAPTLNKLTKSYDYANLKWNSVTNAVNYRVIVVKHEGSVPYINLLTSDLETEMLTVEANTQYDYTVMAVGNGTTYCDESNPLLAGSFTTDDYPAATLTLSENEATHDFLGENKLNDEITLPSTVSKGVDGKVFVGWSADAERATAPEYAKGASYTLSSTTQTLYAVYATEGAGSYMLRDAAPANGDSVIIALLDNTTYKAMTTAGTPSTSNLTVSEGVVSSPAADVKWTVASATTGVYLRPNGANGSSLHMNTSALKVATGDTNGDIIFSSNGDGSFKATRADGARWIVGTTTFGCSATENDALDLYIFKYIPTYSGYVTTGVYTPTAVDNTDAAVKAVKTIVNGQLFILRGEKVYTIQGQLVK